MKNFLFLGAIATLVNPRLLFCASTSTTLSVDPSVDKKTQRKNRRRVRRRRIRTYYELIENSPMNGLIDNDTNETVAPKGSDNAGRIIGGTPTDRTLGKYNYVAQFSNGPACGGMLIAPNIILTAAHCRGGFKNAYLGFYDYNSPKGREEIKIKDEIIHPYFNKDTFENDYMIVVLEKDSKYNPVCITNRQFLSHKDWLVALGFGFLSPGGSLANKMHKVSVQYINNLECIAKYKWYNKRIFNNMLCADSSSIGHDACQGDSGGPIIRATINGHIAVGVVSWGIGCAQLPGVYSRISWAYNWIKNRVHENGGSLPQSCNWAKKL